MVNKKGNFFLGLCFVAIVILTAICSVYITATHYNNELYWRQQIDPLDWTRTRVYRIVQNYVEDDYPYQGEDVYDCDHIASEIGHRVKLGGYNASIIVVLDTDDVCYEQPCMYHLSTSADIEPRGICFYENGTYNCQTNTWTHALVRIPIWVDIDGELQTPGMNYVYYYSLDSTYIEQKISEHESTFPEAAIQK